MPSQPMTLALLIAITMLSACGGGSSSSTSTNTNDIEALGEKLFSDENLSSEGNQSCASCHSPDSGFADPDASVDAPVSEGSPASAFGNRNAPTAAYASFTPDFVKLATPAETMDGTVSNYQGGQFLDGRAIDLVEQAKGPFLNPVEMNNVDETDVVTKVQNASYASDFTAVFGADAFDDTDQAYHNIAVAIAAFESSSAMNPFTSKFDLDRANFTDSEERGFDLFNEPNKAKCANCHLTDPDPISGKVLFTDFNYYNVGVPQNQKNPVYEAEPDFRDGGLGSVLDDSAEQGKFRTPTLRNVELTAPYMHNGVHETLEEVITHYDLFGDDNITPEVNANLAEELGQPLGLQPQDFTDLENFMLTLTDGYRS
ncbi:MAG: cytochrome-c peroxidase [Gammaproteobacteria bacterium]|nr:cytochrome-c peroxidase [Gammaproteobacteria bacterium]